MRRAAYGWLLCPEVSLRDLPRITVRGQTVQGGSALLRKAPLPSSVCPWSTRRHCGPLAFRRATEGSRVLRKGWGVKRGRETLVSLPLLPPAVGTAFPRRRRRPLHTLTLSVKPPPAANRCIGGRSAVIRRQSKRDACPRAGLSHPAHRTVYGVLRPVRCVLRRMPQRRVQHRTRRHNAHHCPRDRSRRDTRYKW